MHASTFLFNSERYIIPVTTTETVSGANTYLTAAAVNGRSFRARNRNACAGVPLPFWNSRPLANGDRARRPVTSSGQAVQDIACNLRHR